MGVRDKVRVRSNGEGNGSGAMRSGVVAEGRVCIGEADEAVENDDGVESVTVDVDDAIIDVDVASLIVVDATCSSCSCWSEFCRLLSCPIHSKPLIDSPPPPCNIRESS